MPVYFRSSIDQFLSGSGYVVIEELQTAYYKLHNNEDAHYKLICKVVFIPANVDDERTFERVLRSDNTGSRVLAGRGYDSAANRRELEQRGQRDGIARRAQPGQVKRGCSAARDRTINQVQARIEHAFAGIAQLGSKRVRALTLALSTLAITMQCVATNLKRLV